MNSPLERLRTALADRYRIDRELGTGGMATVYLAHDLKHDREVAIKVLHPDLGAALGSDRFLSEIKTTAKLQHPHILPLLDSGEADGLLYYVMPYVTGETLRARIERERQLPIDDALRIAREVADALGAAHAIGIIHRDVKPENILLQSGHALVADFGIALAVQSAGGARMTQTGLSLGTPQYMSPEQAMGEKVIDLRADIYALGAVAYEMLVGEPPFTGASVQAIVAKVMNAEPQAPTLVRKTIPAHVERAVLRALAKLPADRFASAAEFSAALSTTETAFVDSARARSQRRSWVTRTPLLLGVAAAALAGGWLLGRGRAHSTDARGAFDVSVTLPDSVTIEPLAPVPEGEVAIALSPDASMLVVVGRTASGARLFMRRLGDDQLRPLAGTERGYAPFFSPRGDQIGFFADGNLKRYSVSEQRTTTVASTGGKTWGGAWVADGRLLVSLSRATSLLMMTANGDSIREIPCGGNCGNPEALPDGRHALVSAGTHLSVVDLERGSIEPLRGPSAAAEGSGPAGMRGTLPRYDGDGHLVWVDTDGHLLAAPFDASRCEFTGPPVPIASDVRVESGRGSAQFALSRNGVLAYANGPLMSVGTVVRSDRAGRLSPLPIGAENYSSLELAHDGRRMLASVNLPTGERTFHIIDITTGRDAPWVTGRDLMDRPHWWPGEHKVTFRRGSKYFLLDPELATPPEELTVSAPGGLYALLDSERYLSYAHDTAVVARFDGKGQSIRVAAPGAGSPAVSPDGRWLVNEEQAGSESGMVAHALDGSQRRVVIGSSSRFSMPYWEVGSTELILAAQKANDGGQADAGMTQQEFWAVSYTPSAAQPFGEPRFLFRANVADFPGRSYSVGGGGSVFVFKQHIAARPLREVRLLVNWHQRLEALPVTPTTVR
jgi:hypothetical protein